MSDRHGERQDTVHEYRSGNVVRTRPVALSLTAVELASGLRRELGVPVGIRTLFEAQTVNALATLVETSGKPA